MLFQHSTILQFVIQDRPIGSEKRLIGPSVVNVWRRETDRYLFTI